MMNFLTGIRRSFSRSKHRLVGVVTVPVVAFVLAGALAGPGTLAGPALASGSPQTTNFAAPLTAGTTAQTYAVPNDVASAPASVRAEAATIKTDAQLAAASPAAQKVVRTPASETVLTTVAPDQSFMLASCCYHQAGCWSVLNKNSVYNFWGNLLYWVQVNAYTWCIVQNIFGVWVMTATPWSSYSHGEHLDYSWCAFAPTPEGWTTPWIRWFTHTTSHWVLYPASCGTPTANLTVGVVLNGDGSWQATY